MRSEQDIHLILHKYSGMIRKICFMHLSNYSDVEDVFQEVFLKYALHDDGFSSDEHEKAWLIRVAVNACKDVEKSFWHRRVTSLTDVDADRISVQEEHQEVLDAVLRLTPPKYRDVIYLYYYEGYKAVEIAAILGKKENTIYTWLARAREQLKSLLGGGQFG